MKFYPPIMVIVGIIAQVIIANLTTPPFMIATPLHLIGAVFILAGLYPILAINRAFKRHKTSIIPDAKPSALLDEGLFRFSRNPIYVGMALILTGSALLTGNIYGLGIVALFVFAVQALWIKKEEENLENAFGDLYLDYKSRVRRWL